MTLCSCTLGKFTHVLLLKLADEKYWKLCNVHPVKLSGVTAVTGQETGNTAVYQRAERSSDNIYHEKKQREFKQGTIEHWAVLQLPHSFHTYFKDRWNGKLPWAWTYSSVGVWRAWLLPNACSSWCKSPPSLKTMSRKCKTVHHQCIASPAIFILITLYPLALHSFTQLAWWFSAVGKWTLLKVHQLRWLV